MASKADFDAMQWQTVSEAPALAGLIVITAERGGTIRESLAMAKAYTEALKEHQGHDLLSEVVEKMPQVNPSEFSSVEDVRMQGLERIRSAVEALEGKASPEEIEAYKHFTLTVAERAAEADKSGGVLGIGGTRVSDKEEAAPAEIASTLGVERRPAG